MNVTNIQFEAVRSCGSRLRAFCRMTINDELVIRNAKVVEGDGGLFVAMPSRMLQDRCPRCSTKNDLPAKYCSECGGPLAPDRATRDDRGRPRLFVDVCHPVNTEARRSLEGQVLAAFEQQLRQLAQPAGPVVETGPQEACRGHLERYFASHPDPDMHKRAMKVLRFMASGQEPMGGKPEGWAAGIVYALANDGRRPSGAPGMLNADFEAFFSVSMPTVRKRAGEVERAMEF